MTNLNVAHLEKLSVPVMRGFSHVEPRKWDTQAILLELTTEIGSLGRALTIWENFRHGRRSKHQLLDELSDVLFVLIRLAHELKIQLPSALPLLYGTTTPIDCFFGLNESAVDLRTILLADRPTLTKPVQPIIEEMMMLIGQIAVHYQVPLETGHEEEMALARRWQTTFFPPIAWLTPWRKITWWYAVWRHQKSLDNV